MSSASADPHRSWLAARDRILAYLRRPVPTPPPTQPPKSFAGLKPGQRLMPLADPPAPVIVAAVDRQGATLSDGTRLDRQWPATYQRVRKRTQKKDPTP